MGGHGIYFCLVERAEVSFMSGLKRKRSEIIMSNLVIAGEKLKLYEYLTSLCAYVQYTDEWRDQFWERLLKEEKIYLEFLYYADHQDFQCKCKIDGYSVIDILVWQMRKYNVRTDRGKNGADCDKMAMVLESFRTMLDMVQNGSKIEWSMEMNNGMDQL